MKTNVCVTALIDMNKTEEQIEEKLQDILIQELEIIKRKYNLEDGETKVNVTIEHTEKKEF